MKKILIVEDVPYIAAAMAAVLSELGHDVTVCTMENKKMPSVADVLQQIAAADVIFLDHDLGTDYTGGDLFELCQEKVVIGISNSHDFGNSPRFKTEKRDMHEPKKQQIFKEFVTNILK